MQRWRKNQGDYSLMYKKNSKDGKKCNAPFFIDVCHYGLILLFYFDTKNRLENNLPIN